MLARDVVQARFAGAMAVPLTVPHEEINRVLRAGFAVRHAVLPPLDSCTNRLLALARSVALPIASAVVN